MSAFYEFSTAAFCQSESVSAMKYFGDFDVRVTK